MRMLILGVGDAFTRRSFGSSALIEAPAGWVLLDCPDLIHRALFEAVRRVGWVVASEDVDDVLLTHLHGDHCNGLESFGFARRTAREGRSEPPPRLHTSRPAAERLWERLAPAMDGAGTGSPRRLEDFFGLHVLEPGQTSFVAGLSVQCRFTKHPVPTIGLLISDGNATLGWSGDTPFEQAHVDWLASADLIVHECNRGPAHTPLQALEDLPAELKRKLHLIHLPDDFDAGATDLALLREGEVLEL